MSRYLRRGNRLLKEVRIELRADSQAPGGAAPVCQGHLICDRSDATGLCDSSVWKEF